MHYLERWTHLNGRPTVHHGRVSLSSKHVSENVSILAQKGRTRCIALYGIVTSISVLLPTAMNLFSMIARPKHSVVSEIPDDILYG
jgi:hypothetical protein